MPSGTATIRVANMADARGILDIYGPYIEHSSYNFELEVPSLEAFAARISGYLRQWPWLVCARDGCIAGYAYASIYRERLGYQWSCECSVYIHDNYMQQGIGRALYTALLEILRRQGYRNVYAVINLPNETSVAFHESMGFRWALTFENVGYKLGQWKNVGWWMRQVNNYSGAPAPPTPFPELEKDFLPALLEQCSAMIR